MKVLSLLLFLFLLSAGSHAQNSALTATKVNAVSARAIDVNTFEFEPNFFTQRQADAWDGRKELSPLFPGDSILVESGLSFRMSYSPMKGMEVATVIPADVSETYLAMKYVLLDSAKIDLNVFAGVSLPFGNRITDRNTLGEDNMKSYGFGIGATHDFNEQWSLDLSAEYQLTPIVNKTLSDLFLFADLGYYIQDGILLFNSIGYMRNHPELFDSYAVSMYPGFAIERGQRFVIAINGQFDLAGQNAIKTTGVNMALTLEFD